MYRLTAELNSHVVKDFGELTTLLAVTEELARLEFSAKVWQDDWDAIATDTETGERLVFIMGCWNEEEGSNDA